MHYSYNDILDKATPADEGGYRYLNLLLEKGDSCVNPASTKRLIYGPNRVGFQIHASGIATVLDVAEDWGRPTD